MTRIAALCTEIVLALSAGLAAGADLDPRKDLIVLCGKERQPSDSVKPSAWRPLLNPLIKDGRPDVAYARLANVAGGAVRAAPGAERFLALLRNPGPRSFAMLRIGPNERIFTPPDTITIECGVEPVPQPIVDLATVALLAERVRVRDELPLSAAREAALKEAAHGAEDMLTNGLAMWPWEMWLNGLRLPKEDSGKLFRTQWVFMRPTAGIEIDTYSQASADLQASVMLEPFGFIHYRGKDHAHWWGLSFVVTSSTNRGAGAGALFRWDNYVIGLTRHKGQGSRPDSNFLLIGVELYDLFNKKREELKNWDGSEALLKWK